MNEKQTCSGPREARQGEEEDALERGAGKAKGIIGEGQGEKVVFSIEEAVWFAARFRTSDNGCRVWSSYGTKDGYGRPSFRGNRILAHRLSWLVNCGTIPAGIFVLHECDNPPCVNPAHLFLGTQLDNIRDRDAKGRQAPSRGDANGSRLHPETVRRGNAHHARLTPEVMSRGDKHYARTNPERLPRGDSHGQSKLTSQQVVEIRAAFSGGDTDRGELARKYSVSKSNINPIINRKIWSHI